MFDFIKTRLEQGTRTIAYPKETPAVPPRFRGLPVLDSKKCEDGCRACIEVCPTEAIANTAGTLQLDLGRCIFCSECTAACPSGAITLSQDFRLATRTRDALVLDEQGLRLAEALDNKARSLFGRSLKLRQVSAGGCNACESDVNVLSTIVFDIGRFGIQFVASPRHADGLLITGTLPRNMELALKKTYAAVPDPKLVIAVGACAISGGLFRGHPEVLDGAGGSLPIDLYVPGCPPHPLTILDGLLRLLGRIESGERKL